MTRTRLPVLLSFVVCAVGATPAAAESGAVDAVLVFADRAEVTRVQAVDCRGGSAVAEWKALPAGLDVRTLRGGTRAGGRVIGLRSEAVNVKESLEPRARALDEQLEKVRDDIAAQEQKRASVLAALHDLDAYSRVLSARLAEDIRNPRPDLARMGRDIEVLRAKREALAEARTSSDAQLRALRLTEQRLARERAHYGAGVITPVHTAAVTLECEGRARITATVSYVVPGATWQPEYEVDFSAQGRGKTGPGRVRIVVGAVIRQATGEDWDDARVLLSTAKPRLGSEAPRLAPLWVDAGERSKQRVVVEGQERREDLASGGLASGLAAQSAGVDDKGNTFVLTLPHRVRISSDGRPTWVPIDILESKATGKLVAVPKLDEHVYRVVAFDNPAGYPLVEGRVHGYRDGSFVGDTRIEYRGIGEPVEISLGVDDEVQVERSVLDDRSKDAKLFSSDKKLLRAFRNTVKSGAGGRETVEVREHIPVASTRDIKVEVRKDATTPGYRLDARKGFLTWQLTLEPGHKRLVDLSYVVSLPEDWQVNLRR